MFPVGNIRLIDRNKEIWEYGNMGIWEYGNMRIWEYGNYEHLYYGASIIYV